MVAVRCVQIMGRDAQVGHPDLPEPHSSPRGADRAARGTLYSLCDAHNDPTLQALGIMLEDYSCEVLDKRQFVGQDWDYISAEAVLCEQRANPNTRKRLKRAIADARLLITLARGSHQSTSSSFLAEQSSYEPLLGESMLLSDSWLDEASALASVSSMPAHKITPRSCSAESQRYGAGPSFGHDDTAVIVSERGDSSDDVSDAHVVVACGNHGKDEDDYLTGQRLEDLCEIHFLQACGPPLVSLSPSPSHSPRKDLKRCQPRDGWGDHDIIHPAGVHDICDGKASPTFKRVRSNSLVSSSSINPPFSYDCLCIRLATSIPATTWNAFDQRMSALCVRQLPRRVEVWPAR